MKLPVLLVLLIAAAPAPPARAWEKHQSLMPWIMQGISGPARDALYAAHFAAPCPDQDRNVYQVLAQQLKLNPLTPVPPTAAQECAAHTEISAADVLLGPSVDDPDRGMDEDLDPSYDPNRYRSWMGGLRGPTSKGFRHQYFGGWQWHHPVSTFQIPLGAIGEAPDRVELFARKGRELIKAGQPAWGMRLLAWSIHYLQDLAQPFHSVQIVDLKMVPWYVALTWPPDRAFEELVAQTTRAVSNYHWALEGYALKRLHESESPFSDCVLKGEGVTVLDSDAVRAEPRALALAVAHASIDLAPVLGKTELRFFGPHLKQREFDLPHQPSIVNFEDYALRPDLTYERQDFEKAVCTALANASWATRRLIEWAVKP